MLNSAGAIRRIWAAQYDHFYQRPPVPVVAQYASERLILSVDSDPVPFAELRWSFSRRNGGFAELVVRGPDFRKIIART